MTRDKDTLRKSSKERKNPASREVWIQDKRKQFVNEAPKPIDITCPVCEFTTHDRRKYAKHICKKQ